MILSWFRSRRRSQLRARPFPADWLAVLKTNVVYFAELNADEQAKLLGDIQVFIAEKNWEGCGGLTMIDEIKVTVAAQACLLVLGHREQYFDRVQSILVYPENYLAPDQTAVGGGFVLEGDSARAGEAWYRGPVILSWPDVLAGGQRRGHAGNLVFHEFAHQLDMLNGHAADGVPPLENRRQLDRWTAVINRHFEQLVRDCRHRRPTLLDCYGTTNLSEFFAVATEAFFGLAAELKSDQPELYEILRDYYRQDPAARQRA